MKSFDVQSIGIKAPFWSIIRLRSQLSEPARVDRSIQTRTRRKAEMRTEKGTVEVERAHWAALQACGDFASSHGEDVRLIHPAAPTTAWSSTMPALLFEVRNHIAYLTLNRPQVHNSINPELMVQLADAWERVNAEDEIRIAIVTGAGDKSFCTGADLGRLIPLTTGARPPEDEWDRKVLSGNHYAGNSLLRGYDVYKPIIGAVNGFCIAGGMELMLATDIRVAAEHATFGLQEVKWALLPAGGSLPRLPRQMPFCEAMEILLTGERITAEKAWRLGLINYVLPAAQVMAKAEEIATTIAANGPLAVRKIKEAVLRCSGRALDEGFKIENEIAREVFSSQDAREGPRAFMEKRKPTYIGR